MLVDKNQADKQKETSRASFDVAWSDDGLLPSVMARGLST